MPDSLLGLHHLTAIASDIPATLRFYTQTLGLRFVKKTVNFDDPTVYHLYFGDLTGQPGTILTFFTWRLPPGRKGTGSIDSIALSIPTTSVEYWQERLKKNQIEFETEKRFGETVMRLQDPNAMTIELVAQSKTVPVQYWKQSTVPEEHFIRGMAGITLLHEEENPTADFLKNVLDMHPLEKQSNVQRFQAGHSFVDLKTEPEALHAIQGNGSIHHAAFRAKNAQHQLQWREQLVKQNANVTQVIERYFFQSIYFHEPGRTLFEIATDPPGFLVDQTTEELGTKLSLPPWFEANRKEIEKQLPPI